MGRVVGGVGPDDACSPCSDLPTCARPRASARDSKLREDGHSRKASSLWSTSASVEFSRPQAVPRLAEVSLLQSSCCTGAKGKGLVPLKCVL